MSQRPWHKRFHADMITSCMKLTVSEKGAFNTIMDLIYDEGGPIPYDEKWVARCAGCSTRMLRTLISALSKKGKITVADGRITNGRCEDELCSGAKEHHALSESGASGGRKSAESRSNKRRTEAEPTTNQDRKSHENDDECNTINELPENGLKHRARVHIPYSIFQSTEDPSATQKESVRARGSRLDPNWHPGEAGVCFARDRGLNPEETLAEFRDYWLAKSGKDAVKLDWQRTWQNSCRLIARRHNPKRPPGQTMMLLAAIPGGKSSPTPDPTDPWGILAWCDGLVDRGEAERVEENGKLMCLAHQCHVNVLAKSIAEMARLPTSWCGDWSPVIQWLSAGINSRVIHETIHKRAGQGFREPVVSLRFFDAMMQQHRSAA